MEMQITLCRYLEMVVSRYQISIFYYPSQHAQTVEKPYIISQQSMDAINGNNF
jgi:hypothetical protein